MRKILTLLFCLTSITSFASVIILPPEQSLGQSFAQGFVDGFNQSYYNRGQTQKKGKISVTDLYGNTTSVDLETGVIYNQYGIQGYIK